MRRGSYRARLRRQWKARTFGDVQVEEVAVEHRLHHAGHDGDQVVEVLKVEAAEHHRQPRRSAEPPGDGAGADGATPTGFW